MENKLKSFCYSQNSINTYKSCPLKFKYKYIDRINWKYDDIDSRDYYESLRLGRDFHLLCERYFSGIPLGYIESEKFSKWIDKVKKLVPIKDEYTYLPEYELRLNINGYKLQAKYDLIVLGNNSIEIYDWKTENRKIDYKNVENRMQTILYMYIAKEVICKLENNDINSNAIKMKYYQPEFDNEAITIIYSDQKHISNRNKIIGYLNLINQGNFEQQKNRKHCKYCEFNKLCNGQAIDYDILEDDIYGT